MQQRRLRLGDILDDYCPRERRVTNHAIVAMVDDEVKQTRCTTCDADHEYKQARVPPPRRRKAESALAGALSDPGRPRPAVGPAAALSEAPAPSGPTARPEAAAATTEPVRIGQAEAEPVDLVEPAGETRGALAEDDGPVHRRLIRATLPRPDGQAPERKEPDFTVRQQPGRGFDGGRGKRPRARRRSKGLRFGAGPQAPHQGSGQSGGPQPPHGNRQRPARQRGHHPGDPVRGSRGGQGRSRGPRRGR